MIKNMMMMSNGSILVQLMPCDDGRRVRSRRVESVYGIEGGCKVRYNVKDEYDVNDIVNSLFSFYSFILQYNVRKWFITNTRKDLVFKEFVRRINDEQL